MYCRCVLIIIILFFAIPLFGNNPNFNEKPFVIPELKNWKGAKGNFILTENSRITYPGNNPELKRIAELFAEDFYTMFGRTLEVTSEKAKSGDILLQITPNKKLGKEGYQIKISDKIVISAPESQGLYWATRTLLQMAEQNEIGAFSKGEITDWPDYELRGFMLDCGRKFIPLSMLQDYVKIMSYYKMNTFQIHLNDNGFPKFFENDWDKTYSAFRLESETYPGLAAQDGFYTKKEFIELQKLAENHFVNIIPEIDIPAHSLAFSHYNKEVGSEEYGMDHLDLFKPETYEFIDALLREYLEGENPVFRGKIVHIGTDEYSNKKKEVVEKFRYFTDYYIKYVESFNKQAGIWGALTHARGETPVKSEDVIMWAWHNNYAQPDSMMQEGYKLVSIPDGLLYIVPNAGYYYNYLNTKNLYENWTPARIGKKQFEEKHPQILGGMFAVWNDHLGNGISTKDIHHRAFPALQTLAVKMWTGKETSTPYNVFNEKRENLSEAPGINIAGKIGNPSSLVFEKFSLKNGEKTGYTEIGYNYTVTFDIKGHDEKPGTILLKSHHAQFYLSDPIKGMLGFSRDGYLYTFNYRIKNGENLNIKICGDNQSTSLYINGELKEKLSIKKLYFDEGKGTMNYTQTLVFPLEEAGYFNSKIENFKVYNYIE